MELGKYEQKILPGAQALINEPRNGTQKTNIWNNKFIVAH